jgi:nicotinamide-nucleotide amidase
MEALTEVAKNFIDAAGERGIKFVTAESCTGGALSTLLSDTPGAGETFFGGFVCYAKEYKERILGVPAALIELETAVSESVARAMAQGALERSGCDLAIAITGVTGPKPDEDGNPVGLVHIAVARKDGSAEHAVHRLDGETPGKLCGAAIREALTLAMQLQR